MNSMDTTRLSDIKDDRSTGDVFKKKFTSLSRPRQPLRETNANLPTLPFKRSRKHSSSYSSPKGKDGGKSSPKKAAIAGAAAHIVSPTMTKTKENSSSKIGETLTHPTIERPIEVVASQHEQKCEVKDAISRVAEIRKLTDGNDREKMDEEKSTSLRKRDRDIGRSEETEQTRTTVIRRKLSTVVNEQQEDAIHKEEAPTLKAFQKDDKLAEPKEDDSLQINHTPSKKTSLEIGRGGNDGKVSAIESVRVNQKQHTEKPTFEKPRTLIDVANAGKIAPAPLQELDSNKVDRKSLERPEKRKLTQQVAQNQKGTSRLSGEELYQWQQSWKKIMKESVVFFEGAHDFQSSEYKRAVKYLKYVGSEIAPFYRTNVTIIISKRTYDDKLEYPSNDIFSNVPKFKTKVWSYEKLFRFMKNLGLSTVSDESLVTGANASAATAPSNNLYNLLKEEKLYGVADRDPNARRDDFHYFGKNYLYVYDLSQTVRPIAIREWNNDYPVLHLTLDGKCPFIDDPSDQNSERKRLKRMRKFEATKSHRQALRTATERVISGVSLSMGGFNGTSTSTDKIDESSNEVEFRQPLTRNSSCIQSKAVDAMASGFNGASNAVQFSMDSNLNSAATAAGNGLGPYLSQVQSKNLNNLKRRIFLKRKTSGRRDKESTPGYCENCRCKYDNFEDHIYSNRHRNFACDDRNFTDIDELIATLKESNSMGNITSNGDYI
ncbi:DBF4 [Candida theae]|uniref:DBF4 n=1 Tax=Candida theae TaxID=1198502 RepID=A0AAD5BI61_9ASCO|nr:DBF4 [Candida theae]KAI5965080.1 DBF4 [Candida theae]